MVFVNVLCYLFYISFQFHEVFMAQFLVFYAFIVLPY
jgi:hypothetical protein